MALALLLGPSAFAPPVSQAGRGQRAPLAAQAGRGHCRSPSLRLAVRADGGVLGLAQLHLSRLLTQSRAIPCPFFRRRAGDSIEAALTVARELGGFLAARHKSLELPSDLLLPAPPERPKARGQSLEAVMEAVRRDYEAGQYYVSGRLTQSIYADSCYFDGPDPDMPVHSLQRYSDALRGLFDPELSSIELLGLEARGERRFAAHWRLHGALKLPWRPTIPDYTGATIYELDAQGLICCHTEAWSISAAEAFVATALPVLQRPAQAPSLTQIEADAERAHKRALLALRRGEAADGPPHG